MGIKLAAAAAFFVVACGPPSTYSPPPAAPAPTGTDPPPTAPSTASGNEARRAGAWTYAPSDQYPTCGPESRAEFEKLIADFTVFQWDSMAMRVDGGGNSDAFETSDGMAIGRWVVDTSDGTHRYTTQVFVASSVIGFGMVLSTTAGEELCGDMWVASR